MIDLHTHVLPCMDDGSRNTEQSNQMLRAAQEQGVELLAATPHFYAQKESPQNFLHRRQMAFDRLKWEEPSPRILLGAEVAYFSGISHCSDLPLLCIQGTDLVLIEMPFYGWSRSVLEEVEAIYQRSGLTPVLAHIERYRKLPNFQEAMTQLLHCGVRMQCNAEAVLSPFLGRKLLRMFSEGKIHFLGSDCHDMKDRPPNLLSAVRKIEKAVGAQTLQAFDDTARKLLKL